MNNKSILKDPPMNEKETALPMYKEVKSWLSTNTRHDTTNGDSFEEVSVVDTNKRKAIVKDEVAEHMKKNRVSLKNDENDSDIEVLGKVNHVSYASIRSENSLFFRKLTLFFI